MAQGIRDFLPLRPNAAERLAGLRTGDGRALPPCLVAEIRRELRRLTLVEERIGEVETERDSVEAGSIADQRIALLRQVKGIGPVAATVLGREVFHRDFANRRELAGYLGLAPSPWASGSVQRDQGISKAGNARARTILIEVAWLWTRCYQPGSRLARWFRERVGQAKGRLRRILAVALARKLAVALWRYLGTGGSRRGLNSAPETHSCREDTEPAAVAADEPRGARDRSHAGLQDAAVKDGSALPGLPRPSSRRTGKLGPAATAADRI